MGNAKHDIWRANYYWLQTWKKMTKHTICVLKLWKKVYMKKTYELKVNVLESKMLVRHN